MALTKSQMAAAWAQRKAQIDEMFWDGTSEKVIFEELCASVYAGDEFVYTEGILDNNETSLVELLCEYVITGYATASMIDCQKISIPDHSEIIATICLQLKRDGILLSSVQDRLKIKDQNNYDWFASNSNKYSQVMSGLKEVWDRA